MTALLGKIIETRPATDGDDDFILGKRLRALRELAGIPRATVCKKLRVSLSALARLESKADISVAQVRLYVEALGAKLHIDAAFSADNPVALRIADAFDCELADENQLADHQGGKPTQR